MEIVRNLFPFSFGVRDTKDMVIRIGIYLAAGVVVSLIVGMFDWIPLLGLIFTLVGTLVDLYCFVGIVLTVLDKIGAFR